MKSISGRDEVILRSPESIVSDIEKAKKIGFYIFNSDFDHLFMGNISVEF